MDNEPIGHVVEENSLFKKHFSTVTTLSKYIAMILFIALPFAGGWIGYKYSPEKLTVVENIVVKEIPVSENSVRTIVSTSSNKLDIQSVVRIIHEKYGYGSGPRYFGSSDSLFWFSEPHEKDGCNNYSYIELNSGNEIETKLTACPLIDISESYPFHIVLCSSEANPVSESLCVTSLLTLEEKRIPLTKNLNESVINKCVESTFDPYCTADVQSWDGELLARIYKSMPREPYSIYENTELLREEKINLFKEFSLE